LYLHSLYRNNVPTNKMSDDLKRSGGIPGVRPGGRLQTFLTRCVFDNLPGSLFLALIAVFPAIIVSLMDVQQSWAMFFEVLH
jgi:preprotein translocase subunit SecY